MTSIEKALALLDLFGKEPYMYTVAELCEKTGMNRTTVYRDLSAMEAQGLLMRQEGDRYYTIGPLMYRMGNLYLQNAHYEEKVLTVLEEIAAKTKESVGLARRDGDKILSIFSVETHQAVRINDKPGVFYPIYKGLYGKGLMAFWDIGRVSAMLDDCVFEKTGPNTHTDKASVLADYADIRERGYVVSIEETMPYIVGVGVPIRGMSGAVRNIVAVSMFKTPDYEERLTAIRDILLAHVGELARYME